MTATATVVFEAETLAALEELAARSGQARDALLNVALEQWLAVQECQLEQIRIGIAEADRGEFVSNEEIDRIVGKNSAES